VAAALGMAADRLGFDDRLDEYDHAESHEAFVGRVRAVLAELTAAQGTTVAVSSAGVIAAASALVLGLPVDRWPGWSSTRA